MNGSQNSVSGSRRYLRFFYDIFNPLECVFLGGFVFFVFIFVDGLANRGHNRGRNHLYYYKQGFIMHQLVLEILPSSSLIFTSPISSATLGYFLDCEHF